MVHGYLRSENTVDKLVELNSALNVMVAVILRTRVKKTTNCMWPECKISFKLTLHMLTGEWSNDVLIDRSKPTDGARFDLFTQIPRVK